MVWMVSILLLISDSSSRFSKLSGKIQIFAYLFVFFLLCGPLKQLNPLDGKISFFVNQL